VTREARDMAEELGVHIFSADIIYHLFDQFKAYLQKVRGVIGQLWVTAFEP
jgi:translation initiation factor 5B